MVTAFKGSRLCTMRGFPSFFATVNHRERYAELDDSYTPAAIFRLICSHTSR